MKATATSTESGGHLQIEPHRESLPELVGRLEAATEEITARARHSFQQGASEIEALVSCVAYQNGLHKQFTDAKAAADALDTPMEGIQRAIHEHFHGGAE